MNMNAPTIPTVQATNNTATKAIADNALEKNQTALILDALTITYVVRQVVMSHKLVVQANVTVKWN